MKASELRLEELVHFSRGSLDLHGRRLFLHPLHAFAHFRHELIDSAGPYEAKRIFSRFGLYWGQADAAAMTRIFEWESTREWLLAAEILPGLQGIANVKVETLQLDEQNGRLEMALAWHDSAEVEEHFLEYGKAEDPVCWILTGYFGGYASFCLGTPVYFIEQQCKAMGAAACRALGRTREGWGKEIKPQLAFFEAEDIRRRVVDLTQLLKAQGYVRGHRKAQPLPAKPHPDGHPAPEQRAELASPAFRKVIDIASRVALHDSSVLITGESGVGKEIVAREIHRLSPRRKGPFLGINCSALPESLLESELFGHCRGAFTGAAEDRAGLFEQSQQGTVFLDEIGDISPGMQLRLLRVLQEREIIRVGESRARKVNIRVIAATNRNLQEAIESGMFRRDLYYRLGVIELEIPPLRERPEDILPLARHFVERLKTRLGIRRVRLDSTCIDPLLGYDWPGNARELENAIERAAVLSPDGVIRPEYLPAVILHPATDATSKLYRTLDRVERDHIQRVLASVNGNRKDAAEILGISPVTLWRRLKHMPNG